VRETPNIWRDAWEFERDDEEWAADKTTPLPRGEKIGAMLYEIPPGKSGGYYHFHHGAEELLVVLRGRPTLREPGGERVLEEGDVVTLWSDRLERINSSTVPRTPFGT